MSEHRSLFDLSGSTALVTGGNGGIGLGVARGLGLAGSRVVLVARDSAKGDRAVRELEGLGISAAFVAADLTSPDRCRAAYVESKDAFGAPDILVNNAGTNLAKQPQDYSADEWWRIQHTNLDAAYFLSVSAFADMAAAGRGKIINIGSLKATFASAASVPYAASKGAVVQLTRGLAVAWGPHHIQCNVIIPGWITTDMTERVLRRDPQTENAVLDRTPAGRWGRPDDLQGAAVFLASAASDFVTGVSIQVDGGYSVKG